MHKTAIHTFAIMFLLLPFVSSFLFAYLQYLVTFFLSKDQKNRKDQYRTSIHLSYHPWKYSRRKAKKIWISIFQTNKTHLRRSSNPHLFLHYRTTACQVHYMPLLVVTAYDQLDSCQEFQGKGVESTAFWEAYSQAMPHQSSAGAD